ncbi:serine/threonine protein phosphatase [Malaciobacter molluscorum LMG 25693]|uniref:Metallophosphoesterase (YkuE domain) n=1 Tax=Malaciobacter molluscorum LMG 25693 TaxID=870501 RepID=A0A2G1DHC8_9BACT|nr:metallophosphoesterase [Malaciobacter molluscorum]AXX93697.1 metallophosphoesterase (YkuE domain) [Malaciobacter molluscorum LMG 25693]PHO17893.1 serine/threonine protein phosphatase [Malaciobacter molluscorum LMG 25693]
MKLPKISNININIKNEDLHNMQILHLSDLHINKRTSVENIKTLVDICNNIKYDILVITGDIIDCKVKKIQNLLKILNNLEKVYYISGNHDLFYGIKDLEKILDNFNFIDNKTLFIKYNDKNIAIAGLSDRFSKFFKIKRDENKIINFLKKNKNSILLAHQPKDYNFAVNTNTNLFLCGHTHGGQIFPFHYLVKLVQPFLNGLHYKKNSAIYVNKGLGTWGIDFRYKANNEITLIKLIHK